MAVFCNKTMFQNYVVPYILRHTTKSKQNPIYLNLSPRYKCDSIFRNMKTEAFNIRPEITLQGYVNACQASSDASANQLSFLNEANKVLNTSSDSATNLTKNQIEIRSEETTKNALNINQSAAKKQSDHKPNKRRKRHLFRNQIQLPKDMTKNRLGNHHEIQHVMKKPSLSFKEIIENNDVMNDTCKQNDRDANELFSKAAKFYEDKRAVEQQFRRNTPEYAIDWNSAMAMVKETESQFPHIIPTREELNRIPLNSPTFNIAKVIEDFPALQRLVDMGVDISFWEENFKNGQAIEIAMRLDFEKDVQPRILWLLDRGIDLEKQAVIFTKTPQIFNKSLDELTKMNEYLQSKKFSKESIRDIIVDTNGLWLSNTVVEIDSKLGYFQKKFGLNGNEVRKLATGGPRFILWTGVPFQVNVNNITIVDGMGFTQNEAKYLLVNCPDLYWQKIENTLQASFDMVHHTMGLSHEAILQYPSILTKKSLFLKSRHLFLKMLGRDQYNPKKPNYISPKVLSEENDADFCEFGARVPVELYNKFLMTI